MSEIFILGWGSLIWRQGELKTKGDWLQDGPTLPIEFSRISQNGRLTLVIDEQNGAPVQTRWIRSGYETLAEAITNLQQREGSPNAKAVGFADLRENRRSPTAIERHNKSVEIISEWGRHKGADAVIWTAISPRWPLHGTFGVEAAARYAAELGEPLRSEAHEYIRRAPVEVVTPVRTRFEELMRV